MPERQGTEQEDEDEAHERNPPGNRGMDGIVSRNQLVQSDERDRDTDGSSQAQYNKVAAAEQQADIAEAGAVHLPQRNLPVSAAHVEHHQAQDAEARHPDGQQREREEDAGHTAVLAVEVGHLIFELAIGHILHMEDFAGRFLYVFYGFPLMPGQDFDCQL